MTKQNDINPKMRAILIDWLVEVHYKFKLQTATLWLAINILDRYLETTVIVRSKLQLIGVTALLIACKFEEIYPPEVRDCVYITDYAYEREEVLQTESDILLKLNYQLLVPTGYHFMARYLNCIRASERTRTLAGYYSERNLQEIDTLLYKPHMFAASCICAALTQQAQDLDDCNSPPVWNRTLEEESGLKLEDIIECTKTLVKHVSEEPQTTSKRKLIAAKKKYSAEKYQNASSLPLPIFVEL